MKAITKIPSAEDLFVYKTNMLIDAAYKLTQVEQYLIILAMCKRRQDGDIQNTISISSSEFCDMFPSIDRGHSYDQLKTAASNLYDRSISGEFDMKDGAKKTTRMRWIYKAVYINDEARVEITFSPEILPHFLRINGYQIGYTKYSLDNVNKLTSPNTIRIYELLKKDAFKGKSEINICDLRSILKISEHEYPRMTDFKKRIVDYAVDQINKFTDIRVRYENVKRGKEIYALDFTIKSVSKLDLPTPVVSRTSTADAGVVKRLAAIGMSIDSAVDLVGKWDKARLAGNLEIVEQRIANAEKTGKSIGNYVAYLNKALAADWRPVEAEIDIKRRKQKEAKATAAAVAKEKQVVKDYEALAALKARHAEAQEAYDKMSPDEKLKTKFDFLKVLQAGSDAPLIKSFKTSGISTPRAKVAFFDWMNNGN